MGNLPPHSSLWVPAGSGPLTWREKPSRLLSPFILRAVSHGAEPAGVGRGAPAGTALDRRARGQETRHHLWS